MIIPFIFRPVLVFGRIVVGAEVAECPLYNAQSASRTPLVTIRMEGCPAPVDKVEWIAREIVARFNATGEPGMVGLAQTLVKAHDEDRTANAKYIEAVEALRQSLVEVGKWNADAIHARGFPGPVDQK